MPKPKQPTLFEIGPTLPEGLVYRPEFISPEEQRELAERIRELEFSQVEMHGVIAKRRTAHFGWNYEYESWKLAEGQPIPEFLLALRDRLRELTRIEPTEFVEVLVSEYPAGAGIGWHRDAPMFGIVTGISLLGECRMRFRPYPSAKGEAAHPVKKNQIISVTLEPRSAYVLQGAVRSAWQHSIPATDALRYSITFRTLRSHPPGRSPAEAEQP